MCQISRPKYLYKKRYSKSTNMCSCEKNFTTTNFDTLPRIEKKISIKFLSWDHLYVDNMCVKFRGQKIHTKKDVWNLPTCVVIETISLLPTLTPFRRLKYCLFTIKFLSWNHFYVDNMHAKFQVQNIFRKKDIQNLPTCVVVRMISLLPTLPCVEGG